MLIREIEGATRSLGAPASWDQGVSKCEARPILDVVTDQGPFMVSAWAPTPEELAAMKAGAEIRLWIAGTSHPVVALEVADGAPSADHSQGHTSFAEMVSGHIHIWREALAHMLLNKSYDRAYVERELKALAEIEAACKVEVATPKVALAMSALKAAMQADPGYAWGWHCNIAMAFYDAAGDTPNKHRIGNEGAARFMRNAFDVDVTQFPEYQALVKGWALLEADEPGMPKVGETWLHRKGERYTVLGVTSVPEAEKAEKFPRTVFYRGPDGRRWTRTLESWNESFTRETSNA